MKSKKTIPNQAQPVVMCKHLHWIPVGYLQINNTLRVQSLYEVFCTDCNHFVNLLTKEIIDEKGLVWV